MRKPIAVFALAAVAAAACSPNRGIANATGPAALHTDRLGVRATAPDDAGAVYALTNQESGNAVASFARAADGTLTQGGPSALVEQARGAA